MAEIITAGSQKELKKHGSDEFPLLVSYEKLSGYKSGSFLWHWHPEIEITLVLDGQILYKVNQCTYHMKAGDILLGNANVLHAGFMEDMKDGKYVSITFLPKIIYGSYGSILRRKYVEPFLHNFSLPAVYIDYSQPWHEIFSEYVREIITLYEEKKEFYELDITGTLQKLWRCMLQNLPENLPYTELRHTQQYAMYLMASFHPDYMKSRECRKALLNVIHKEGESSFMKEIHDYEIDSLLEMDIPCFEIDANSRSVYDGNGGEHKEYLPCTPYESWRMHMKQMSYSDMECQCDYIRLSMEMLKASDGKKKMFPTRIKGYDTDKERKIYSQIRKIVHRICSRAIIREQSAGWAGLQFWDNGHWNLRSGGIYLYDGISGIVLFLAKYLHDFEEKNASAEEIYHLAVLRLKAYTDEIHKKQIYDKNLLTGIVNGESSVVYTYLYLFKLTGKRVWMIYAEKHFSIIERVWKEDSQLDYLSGNAGAIVVAVMLYKETGNLKYYEIAADMEKDLWKKGQETGNGYGWRLKGTDGPLAGMSHGNSGFLMAYAALYECNHKAEYDDKIQLLLRYEDSLYSEKAGNWKDLRESSGESFMNAWCHGAPGILLSRMKLEELFPEDMQIKKDRLNAADSLFYGEQDEKICLCHGMSGNLLIMKKYLRKYGNKKMKEQYEALCDCLLFQLDHPAKISGTEYLNLAFMNGISGTGMALMEIL